MQGRLQRGLCCCQVCEQGFGCWPGAVLYGSLTPTDPMIAPGRDAAPLAWQVSAFPGVCVLCNTPAALALHMLMPQGVVQTADPASQPAKSPNEPLVPCGLLSFAEPIPATLNCTCLEPASPGPYPPATRSGRCSSCWARQMAEGHALHQ